MNVGGIAKNAKKDFREIFFTQRPVVPGEGRDNEWGSQGGLGECGFGAGVWGIHKAVIC